jgi:hypothetical protein
LVSRAVKFHLSGHDPERAAAQTGLWNLSARRRFYIAAINKSVQGITVMADAGHKAHNHMYDLRFINSRKDRPGR